MGKLYSRCCLSRLEQWIGPVSDFTLGLRIFYQATDLTMRLLRLQSRRNEWRAPWNFLNTGVTKTYDRLWLSAFSRAMERRGAPIPLRRAMLRWLYESVVVFEAKGIGRTSPPRLGKGVPRGDPSSQSLFRLVLEDLLLDLSKEWTRRGTGLEVEDGRVTCLVCADGVYLCAETQAYLQHMLPELEGKLVGRGLSFQPAKCTWLADGS